MPMPYRHCDHEFLEGWHIAASGVASTRTAAGLNRRFARMLRAPWQRWDQRGCT
jgi:hypothetical protein